MNRNVLSTALAMFGFVIILGLGGCQQTTTPTTNRDVAGATATPSPSPTIDAGAIEAELIKLEREWAGAVQNHDAESVRRLLADDIVITYPDGSTGTKADEVRTVETGAITIESWEIQDPKVTVLNADTAFITGRGIIKNGKVKEPNVSRPIDISGEYRFMDVYARRDGRWQAVASQTTPIRRAAQ